MILSSPYACADSNFYSAYYTQALENADALEHPFSHWKGKSGPGGAEKGKGYALSEPKTKLLAEVEDAGDVKADQHPALKKGGAAVGMAQTKERLNHKGAADGVRL